MPTNVGIFNPVVGVEPWGGRSRAAFFDHYGPSSYATGGEPLTPSSAFGGSNQLGLARFTFIDSAITNSGSYRVECLYGGVGTRQSVNLVWRPSGSAGSSIGIPLSLGAVSAAATQSTYTAAGLVTVVGANTLKAGQFISLSNGTSNAGIFLNGVIVRVISATPTGYTFYFGQGKALAYTIATDALEYQVVQVSATNLLQAEPLASPITGVLATANLLTITQANSLVAGQFVYLAGPFVTASVYALGAIVQVTSASTTGWTAKWQGTIIAQTSAETATAYLLVTNGGAQVASYPYYNGPTAPITNALTVASAATAAGLFTLTATQAYQPGMIVAVQGLGTSTELNGSIGTVITTGLTQLLVKANGWTVLRSTQAETAGYVSVLVTGSPIGGGEVDPGTNLSGEVVRLMAIGG